jgi:hypothetical protein
MARAEKIRVTCFERFWARKKSNARAHIRRNTDDLRERQ